MGGPVEGGVVGIENDCKKGNLIGVKEVGVTAITLAGSGLGRCGKGWATIILCRFYKSKAAILSAMDVSSGPLKLN